MIYLIKYNLSYILAIFFILGQFGTKVKTQDRLTVQKVDYLGVSSPLGEIKANNNLMNSNPPQRKPVLFSDKKDDWRIHPKNNPKALPNYIDDALQNRNINEKAISNSSIKSFEGFSSTGVNPADPTLAVGNNYIVQSVNGTDGALINIWNKEGQLLLDSIYMDNISMIAGAGDPIVFYDHFEDRWILTEFGDRTRVGNTLIVLVSTTNDPLGSYHIYSFSTPFFPDYPKFGLWEDTYIISTNESFSQAIYALDKEAMLSGESDAIILRNELRQLPTIGFQAATPVFNLGIKGINSSEPMVMRMADDGWGTDIESDRLELYELDINFTTGDFNIKTPLFIPVTPFDTDLCGYQLASCIAQPNNAVPLDPLREVLMNKIHYRKHTEYESIVCSHSVDVNDTDLSGVRWYELRKYLNNEWEVHQQGTYSIDSNNRFMPTIISDDDSNIVLAYNISSNTSFPSYAITGRNACDPLGEMTFEETFLGVGNSTSISNRFGDYNDIVIDPTNNSFWTTGMFHSNAHWQVDVYNLSIDQNICNDEFVAFEIIDQNIVCAEFGSELYAFDVDINETIYSDSVFVSHNVQNEFNLIFFNNYLVKDGVVLFSLNYSDFEDRSFDFEIYLESQSKKDTLHFTLDRLQTVAISEQEIPQNGESINSTFPEMIWNNYDNTAQNRIEISVEPKFTNVIYQSNWGLEQNIQIPEDLLELNSTYYWKVLNRNLCGEESESYTYSFATPIDTFMCTTFNNETSIEIPNTASTTFSTIEIEESYIISDVNILNITIDHSFISDLFIEIISPSNTSVVLIPFICNNENVINMGFDDSSELSLNDLRCPPSNGNIYRPSGRLSDFNGENAKGVWTLSIFDPINLDGGTLNNWAIEFCRETTLQNCPKGIIVEESLYGQNLYRAQGWIEILNINNSGGTYNYFAGDSIILNPGFEISKSSVGNFFIQNCNY